MIRHRLNETVTVYRASFVDDGAGGRTKTFAEVGDIRAQVNQPSAQERLAAAQLGAELSHVVHTTYGADVERGDELDAGLARRLRVRDVMHDSRRTYYRLECEVVQSG
jgi:SPP1 family predicted phage head-tail adaptor